MFRGFRIKLADGLLLDVPAKEPRDEILGKGRRWGDRNVARHRVRSSSRPSDRTRSISASIASRSSAELGMPVTLPCDCAFRDPVDALFTWLLGQECEAELFAHHPRKEAADRVLLPTRRLHDGGDRWPLARSQQVEDGLLLGLAAGRSR